MSDEQRDRWGETAEERHARILARDLAWMTYSEACARDGVPRSERDHLIFNDGYAAGKADYRPTAGVVAEEPETRELTTEERHALVEGAVDAIERNVTNRTAAYNTWNNLATDERLVQAIVAFRVNDGRVPVKQEDQTTNHEIRRQS